MIPEKFEYLFLLLLYFLLIIIFLKEPSAKLITGKSFWMSCIVFCATWTLIEIYALHSHWWIFSPNKICGLRVLTVPIEEYIVFALIHLSTSAAYSTLDTLR